MDKDTETNTGWWVEKPDRAYRPSSYAALDRPRAAPSSDRIWIKVGVVVGTVVVLIWGAKTLMGW